MEALNSWAFRDRSAGFRWTFAALAFLLSLGLRHVLDDHLPPGFPYLTFFPAVLLTAFLAGVAEGIVVAVLCGIAAWYFFIAPAGSFALTANSAVALGFYVFIVATQIALIHIAKRARRRLAEEKAHSAGLAEARGLMFQELQHRVSNHLQVVSSLLKFQRREVTDPAAQSALDAAAARLALVARIQRQLHDPARQEIDVARFLRELSGDLATAAGGRDGPTVEVEAQTLRVPAEQAVPFGLIAAELVSNAVEHGSHGAATRIRVALAEPSPGHLRLEVADNGPGLPPGFDLDTAPSLGLTIARQFAAQLGGSLTMTTDGGTRAVLSFPLGDAA
jgi:two-component sensor histidine kinase